MNEGIESRYGRYNTIDFINENTGWIINYWDQKLLKTEDGGETWFILPITNVPLTKSGDSTVEMVDFINDSVGWLMSCDNNSSIYKTEDGGNTWLKQKVLTGDPESSLLQVLDESIIYASNGINLLKTLDGGTSWIDISPNLANRIYESICFLSSDTGFVSGRQIVDSTSIGFLLNTFDGGNNWNEEIMPEFESISGLQFFNMHDSPKSIGYFVADTVLCRTEDFGHNKEIISKNVNSFYCVDLNIIYAVAWDDVFFPRILLKVVMEG